MPQPKDRWRKKPLPKLEEEKKEFETIGHMYQMNVVAKGNMLEFLQSFKKALRSQLMEIELEIVRLKAQQHLDQKELNQEEN